MAIKHHPSYLPWLFTTETPKSAHELSLLKETLGIEAYETTDLLLYFLEHTFYLDIDLTIYISINH